MTKRGPKRKSPLDGDRMATVTCRLPTQLILRIDAETVRVAKESGLTSVNRSDVLRGLLERALRQ